MSAATNILLKTLFFPAARIIGMRAALGEVGAPVVFPAVPHEMACLLAVGVDGMDSQAHAVKDGSDLLFECRCLPDLKHLDLPACLAAVRLSMTIGPSARLWMQRQAEYDLWHVRQQGTHRETA